MTEHVLEVMATDMFGEMCRETLLAERVGTFVQLRPREGKTLLVALEDLCAVLEDES